MTQALDQELLYNFLMGAQRHLGPHCPVLELSWNIDNGIMVGVTKDKKTYFTVHIENGDLTAYFREGKEYTSPTVYDTGAAILLLEKFLEK